jgi:hypothetical protein
LDWVYRFDIGLHFSQNITDSIRFEHDKSSWKEILDWQICIYWLITMFIFDDSLIQRVKYMKPMSCFCIFQTINFTFFLIIFNNYAYNTYELKSCILFINFYLVKIIWKIIRRKTSCFLFKIPFCILFSKWMLIQLHDFPSFKTDFFII